jgi:hypothetical protein
LALVAAVLLYAGWCGGVSSAVKGWQFGLLMGVFVACIHSISNLVTMNMGMKLGLEVAVSNAIGVGIGGFSDRSGLQAASALTYLPRPAADYASPLNGQGCSLAGTSARV